MTVPVTELVRANRLTVTLRAISSGLGDPNSRVRSTIWAKSEELLAGEYVEEKVAGRDTRQQGRAEKVTNNSKAGISMGQADRIKAVTMELDPVGFTPMLAILSMHTSTVENRNYKQFNNITLNLHIKYPLYYSYLLLAQMVEGFGSTARGNRYFL
jgi:hypothetical protein